MNQPEPKDTAQESDRVEVIRRRAEGSEVRSDFVAREEPLEIRVRGRSVAVTMQLPRSSLRSPA